MRRGRSVKQALLWTVAWMVLAPLLREVLADVTPYEACKPPSIANVVRLLRFLRQVVCVLAPRTESRVQSCVLLPARKGSGPCRGSEPT
jgi:hypothetical protein